MAKPNPNLQLKKTDLTTLRRIPKQGIDREQVLGEMEHFRAQDADWKAGKTWCLVYPAGDEHSSFLKKAHNKFFSENGLNPAAFSSLKKMESQAIAMTANLLNGGDEAVGSLTSGGTESILLAMYTYKQWAKRHKPWVLRPNMVVARSVHAAFEKGAKYFGIKLKFAKANEDFRVSVKHIKKLTDRNTIAIVASAPHYPQGVIDPIAEIGAFAKKKKIPFHVDACVGGFMLPWVERLGYNIPVWDFRVPGVTSMSADLHKYGYAAKGASAIIYRNMSYLKHQFFVSTDWPGGVYASATIPGTRPGGPIAAAWATLVAMGEDGYMEHVKASLEVRDRVINIINDIPELEVLGRPDGTMVTYRCTEASGLNTFAVADYLTERGWHFDRHQYPSAIHCTCNASNEPALDEYEKDLRGAVAYVKANPEAGQQGDAAMYGMMADLPIRGLVKYSVKKIMEQMYAPEANGMPDLSTLGQKPTDPLLFRLMDKYGDQGMALMDKATALKDKLLGK